ncbi:MAG: rhodanese-like domain-containing protein [Candidatus Eisenbacteria bacterium]
MSPRSLQTRGAHGSSASRHGAPEVTVRVRRGGPAASAFALTVVLLLAAWGSAAAVQWPWQDEGPVPVYPDVTAEAGWLAQRLEARDVVIVDARPAASHAAGHIPGAVSVPFGTLPHPIVAAGALGELGLTGRGRIVCYGDGPLDGDAAALFWALDASGAEGPMLLNGGLDAWVGIGGSLDTAPVSLPPVRWTGDYRPGRVASAAYVALKFGEDGHEIIDTRGWDAWHGRLDEGEWGSTARDGHVPHALPYDFIDFVSPNGSLRDAEDTRDTFARLGPRPSTPVDLGDEFIVHGEGDADGAVGYFLLRRAGFERVRYFRGGWDEWASDPDLPVVRIVSADEVMYRLAQARRWLRPDAPPASFVFFDVRHWGNHAGGHIPGAVSLTSSFFADSLDVYVDRHWPGVDRSKTPIVTYCYGSNCIRSRNCSTVAARMGFVNVERFYEGVDGWRLADGELRRDEERLEEMQKQTEEARREAEARRAAKAAETTGDAPSPDGGTEDAGP